MKFDSRLVSGLGLSQSAFSKPSDLSSDEKIQIAKALPELDLDDQLSVWLGRLLTEDPDYNVRCEVAITLGYLGYRAATRLHDRIAHRATRYLEKLAGDPSWEVRRNVTIGALQCGAESVLPIVYGLLEDDESEVRDSARYCYQGLSSLYPNAAAKLMIEHHPLRIEPTSEQIFLSHTSPSRLALGRFWKPLSRLKAGLPVSEHIDIQEFLSKENVEPLVPDESATLLDAALSGVSDSVPSGGTAGAEGTSGGGSGPSPPNEPPSGPPSGGGEPPPPGSGGEDRQPEYVDLGEGARYVNSWFSGHPDPIQPLVFGREYELGIEIGPQLRLGSFTTGDPKFSAPPFGDLESLEITVGVISDDFKILDKTAKRMRLPKNSSKRSDPVTFRVQPIKNNQDVFIHIFFYYQNNLFEEALIGARVQVLRESKDERQTAYFPRLVKFLAPVQGPRDVNIQIIESNSSYRLVLFYDFGPDDFEILWCTIPVNRDKIIDLLKGVRDDLLKAVNIEGTTTNGKGKVFYDGEPPETPQKEERLPNLLRVVDSIYTDVLKILARAGRGLFVNLFDSGGGSKEAVQAASRFGQALRDLSSRRGLRIQVLSDDFVIPWNLLFDGDHQGAISPSDFWGFKHVIEEIPSSSRDQRIGESIEVGQDALPIAMNLNRVGTLRVLTEPQSKRLRQWAPAVGVIERFTENEVLDALSGKTPQGKLEYFFCHAGVEGNSQGHFDQSYLGLTSSANGLTLEDIKFATVNRTFQSRPVVFLNACESAKMDGRFYDGFVPRLLAMGACAVIGSDCDIPSLFGAHFGIRFLEGFLKSGTVGEVLLSVRKTLLDDYHNPLGLIYRVFGNADVKLSRSLT